MSIVIAERNIKPGQLENGVLPFFEKVEQESDVKNFHSAIPIPSLAKGRVVVSFGDGANKDFGIQDEADTGSI